MQQDVFSNNSDAHVSDAIKAYKTLPQKRIHNSIPTYTKTYENYQDTQGNVFDDVSTWGRMNEVYTLLSNL